MYCLFFKNKRSALLCNTIHYHTIHTYKLRGVVPYIYIVYQMQYSSQVLVEAFGNDKGVGTRACFGGTISSTVACYVELQLSPPL